VGIRKAFNNLLVACFENASEKGAFRIFIVFLLMILLCYLGPNTQKTAMVNVSKVLFSGSRNTMKTLTSTIKAVSTNEFETHEWNNKSVIFRRERLSPALVEEFGTMAVDTIYKVEGVKPGSNNQQLTISSPFFPLPFSVSVDDIEVTTCEELHYESMIRPYEYLLSLDGSLLNSGTNQ
jgi:hypothetical protein